MPGKKAKAPARKAPAKKSTKPRAAKAPATREASPERAKPGTTAAADASRQIDARIAELGDWRGETLARMRALILEADPGMVEEIKWVKPTNPWGVPTWSHDGIVCTGEVYKEYVKLTFARGASVPDPARLFNASLEGSTRRAIDIREGETVDAAAFRALVKAAVAGNAGKAR